MSDGDIAHLDHEPEKTEPSSEWVTAQVTHLEMRNHTPRHIPVPTKPHLALMRASDIPTDFYQYMYRLVGKNHHWYERRKLCGAELYSIINDDHTHIDYLYADGCPAGFFELDTSKLPDQVEIVYFGLAPYYQGMGLGKWFLSAAISAAWNYNPDVVSLHTNSLDHPSALQLYQRMGFSPVGTSEETVEIWEEDREW